MKTVETKLPTKNIVKIEKMSDGTWEITQSLHPKYGFETMVKKASDGTWEIISFDSKDITEKLTPRDRAAIDVGTTRYYGIVRKVIQHTNRTCTVIKTGTYLPSFGRGLSFPKNDYPIDGKEVFCLKVHYMCESLINNFKCKDSIIKLPAGEIVDIERMPDDTWVITQNVEED